MNRPAFRRTPLPIRELQRLDHFDIQDPLKAPVGIRLRIARLHWKGNLKGFVGYTLSKGTPLGALP